MCRLFKTFISFYDQKACVFIHLLKRNFFVNGIVKKVVLNSKSKFFEENLFHVNILFMLSILI